MMKRWLTKIVVGVLLVGLLARLPAAMAAFGRDGNPSAAAAGLSTQYIDDQMAAIRYRSMSSVQPTSATGGGVYSPLVSQVTGPTAGALITAQLPLQELLDYAYSYLPLITR